MERERSGSLALVNKCCLLSTGTSFGTHVFGSLFFPYVFLNIIVTLNGDPRHAYDASEHYCITLTTTNMHGDIYVLAHKTLCHIIVFAITKNIEW